MHHSESILTYQKLASQMIVDEVSIKFCSTNLEPTKSKKKNKATSLAGLTNPPNLWPNKTPRKMNTLDWALDADLYPSLQKF